MIGSSASLLLLTRLAAAVSVQQNYTICNWARLRAGVVRDALYLDGGLLWWQTAFADGNTPVVSSDGNVAGDMFRLNFSRPFDTTHTNLSALFDRMPKAGGAGNNIAPNYVDGTMLANDGELYLYGGLPRLTDSAAPQSVNSILGYEAFQYGPERQSWSPGFYQGQLPDGVTRYITNGAGVSVPSENLGFYFSGMRSPDWGPIYYDDSSANVTSNTLIKVDLSTMRDENWSNTTLPDNIPPRANAELVWIPVSQQGVLVAIGGVDEPEEIWATGLNDNQTTQSRTESPGFMTTLPVYDIASEKWYLQNTTGDAPPQLTEFCSVVAAANDSSSFNVYIYGGYSGLNAGDLPSDDVWILSMPSFTWIRAYQGQPAHGRSGHRCVMPYPDQILIVGGVHQNQAVCVDGGIIQVFNLNKLEFQSVYNPSDWSTFAVPDLVTKAIGGNANGGSTKTAAWADNSLGSVFAQPYARQIDHYYPYASNAAPDDSAGGGGRSLSSGALVGIIVAVCVVVVVVTLLILLLIRRQRRRRRLTDSEKSSQSSSSRVSRWLNGAAVVTPPSKQHSPAPPSAVPNASYSTRDDKPTPPLQPQRHEMACTERPRPPYELATPYNDSGHPRHGQIADSGYHANYGHMYSRSGSNSNSSGDYQPSPLSNNVIAGAHHSGPSPPRGAGVPDRRHPGSDDSSNYSLPSSTSTSSGETLPWPLPASPKTCRRKPRRFGREPARSRENSLVRPIMEEPEEHDRDMYTQRNRSSNSDIETPPSPANETEGQDAGYRDHRADVVSPISPSPGRP